jgi:hypothetical protein
MGCENRAKPWGAGGLSKGGDLSWDRRLYYRGARHRLQSRAFDGPGTVAQAADVVGALAGGGIEYRLWYSLGLHKQTSFASAVAKLPITDDLAPRLIALLSFDDLAGETIHRIIGRVAEAVGTWWVRAAPYE